jgi:hypothetical protein
MVMQYLKRLLGQKIENDEEALEIRTNSESEYCCEFMQKAPGSAFQ